ncbi:MAG: hypothetical protein M2R45_04513 [Verrucomicrobia subdivision 3 bacterium]|nr:hypothetical protein [Limisphaerales bacterium]MCS1415940.1 hypothetical protein [Limisphaerales bacterium]
MFDKRMVIGLGVAVFVGLAGVGLQRVQAQNQGLLREVYTNIGGLTISDLIQDSRFPSQPTSESIIPSFEAPMNADENYGQRIRGFILPPETGEYKFWISSDDGSALYLGPTDREFDESERDFWWIAEVPGWTAPRQWGVYAEQESIPISLEGGQRYYIEALMKEGSGGDHLAVRWQLPNGQIEEPIPGSRLRPVSLGMPEIAEQPEDVTVGERETAVFAVRLTRTLGASFQWQRDGVDIPGATASVLELESVGLGDSGSMYQVVITNREGTTTSNVARLSVRGDQTAPFLVAVVNLGDAKSLAVTFSEPVDSITASNPANYVIDQGVRVLDARVSGEGDEVVLTTTVLMPGVTYQLAVRNVRDQAMTPNAIGSAARAFSWDFEPLPVEELVGNPEPPGPSARTTGMVITEIHYHPAERQDGLNLEFVELYNSQEWSEDLGDFRLSGDVDFTFPKGTEIESGEYLIIAASPEDVAQHYGVEGVLGPWTGSLPNQGGTVRLRNRADALLLDVGYSDRGDWPVAADGFGHSLVLAKPSYGEGLVEAWAASFQLDGSPGKPEPVGLNPYGGVLVNEFLAHTDDPILDFVELYNYSNRSVDLSGCQLSDGPNQMGYTFPEGTMIPAGGFLSLDQNQLGFSLRSKGEWIALHSPEGGPVIDSIRFFGQANGISTGRFPDGARYWSPLASLTPGASNTSPREPDIVINEIMYHPISGSTADEYVELHNHSNGAIDLSGWRMADEIDYRFPAGTVIAAGGYLVVAKDAARLVASYPNLTLENTRGNFNGTLSNRRARVALERPDTIEVLSATGEPMQDTIWITVDEVAYRDGGQWGNWSDGGGSSLELIDSRSDNRFASNWADSDETQKSEWTTIGHSGQLDNGRGSYNEIQMLLMGGGECLVDDVFVAEADGGNQVSNGDFENGLDGWVIQGNHVRSGLSESGEGFESQRSLHLRATSGGDNGANRVESDLSSSLVHGQTGIIRAKVRWLRGHPDILLRIKGNPLELSGRMKLPTNLGTPGAVNSQARANVGPAILSVLHDPILPQSGQAVTVRAQVFDVDGLSRLVLKYRHDREKEYQKVPMVYRGAGAYTATIPGQSNRRMIAFLVEATDGHERAASTQFPENPWNRECLVRFGEAPIRSDFGTYRLWIATDNVTTWRRREKLSNELIDSTFVYGNFRAIYNARGRFRGSPFIRPGYGSPTSSQPTGMIIVFPEDDLFLGVNKVNLDGLEQPGRDNTLQRERASFWIADQMNLPFSYQRYVQFMVNGTLKGQVYTDSQHPSSEYVSAWFPREREGELFKIDDWFEFNDSVNREFNENAMLRRYISTNGELKLARYRWSWEKKPNGGLDDDHARLFELVEALNTQGSEYEQAVESIVDVEQWMRIFAVRHIVGDWDGYGYRRGKNMSAYKPENGKWKMILWDLDFSLGGGSDNTNHSMFQAGDLTIERMYNHPTFRRAYLRAWEDAINGPLLEANSSSMLDAVYDAFQANQVSAGNPRGVKNWIRLRRSYLIRELDKENADFEITTNSGNAFLSHDNIGTLEGTAPVAVKSIRVNGIGYPIEWTSVRAWRMQVPLQTGVNALSVEGFDLRGNKVSGSEDTITVTFTGDRQDPRDHLVLNELMYNPKVSGTGFVEIHNTSETHSFDLSNYVLNGVDYRFDAGFVLGPQGYAVVVSDRTAFAGVYGPSVSIAGEFSGRLSNNGETISLVSAAVDEANALLIDQVTYEDALPWSPLADGQGSSLQLIDPRADNRRVAHWTAVVESSPMTGPQTLISMTDEWRYNQSGANLDARWRTPHFNDEEWPSGPALLYVEASPLPAAKNTLLTLGEPTYYFRKTFIANNVDGMELEASLIIDDGAVVYLNGMPVLRRRMGENVSFGTFATETVNNAELEGPFFLPNTYLVEGENVIAVEVHQTNATSTDIVFGLSLVGETRRDDEAATPGRRNSVVRSATTLPLLWLNEVQSVNQTGIVDGQGEAEPWVEIYNSGDQPLALGDFYLTSDYQNSMQWKFPDTAMIGPGEYQIVWCDGEPEASTGAEWHANFRLPAAQGAVAMTVQSSVGVAIVDYLNYEDLQKDRSFGAFPNGSPNLRKVFLTPTPGRANDDRAPEVAVFINEWLADNGNFNQDPLDQQFDDWLELYNAGDTSVDLSGYFLSDDPADLQKVMIPDGTVVGPRSFLLVWADGETLPMGDRGDLHVAFRLSRSGEVISLSAPNGSVVDRVEFAAQETNVSQGRLRDGDPDWIGVLSMPTPGSANVVNQGGPNQPPIVSPLPDLVIDEGGLFDLTVSAFDPDGDGSLLRFELGSLHPAGATIDPNTGEIRWLTSEGHGPGRFAIQVSVTDSGSPPQTTTATYGVQVREVNRPPILGSIKDRILSLGSSLNIPMRIIDRDVPVQELRFALGGSLPAGASIDPQTGVVTWTPLAGTEPGTFVFIVSVTDDGSPPLSATRSFEVMLTPAIDEPELVMLPQADGENIVFEWASEASAQYIVQACSDIESAEWTDLTTVTAEGGITQYSGPILIAERRFYRVLRLLNPGEMAVR